MTQQSYSLTLKQEQAMQMLAGPALHCLLYGGSRSGKTFLIVRSIMIRALAAPWSRHAILRFRFNAVKQSIAFDTLPKVMRTCFPQVEYELNKSEWFVALPNEAQVWLGGLDDKERTEKILGQEYVTMFLNECSQIPWASRVLAVTRLAQKVNATVDGKQIEMRRKMYYDQNPPNTAHWTHSLFVRKIDPDTRKPLAEPDNYAAMQVNPADNMENLPAEYLKTLEGLPARARTRFLQGRFGDVTAGALWNYEDIEKWRVIDGELPDMQRIVIAVDPSGSGDVDNLDNDEIGIVVCGLGTDGNAYVLEDLTVKAGPKTWGNIATQAYERWAADRIVAEVNYGGEMVRHVIETARPRTPFEAVTASRGKVVRAEPIGALAEQGKIRHAGYFAHLEEELCSMTTAGYTGHGSPNRADAVVWGMTALFPGIVKRSLKVPEVIRESYQPGEENTAWMG